MMEYLYKWVKNLVAEYDFDGIRIDALSHVPKGFWPGFADSAGVFQMGEVLKREIDFVAPYQLYVSSVFNVPLHYDIQKAWSDSSASMLELIGNMKK